MKTNLVTLFEDSMKICESTESFYFVDQKDADGNEYRTFTYRLASFTEFQQKNALEMRGHTFRKTIDGWKLASLPSQKFFNYGEHVGWGTEVNLNEMDMVMDKLDGSLISTVEDSHGNWFLKSKTSFKSQQANDAKAWLKNQYNYNTAIDEITAQGYTVNFEWLSPTNQIVIGYAEPSLKVLNARHMQDGSYFPYAGLIDYFGSENVVHSHPIPVDGEKFIAAVDAMTGIEGFVIRLKSGLMFKIKTIAYAILHHLKDSVNSPKRLWEACINETGDDLRALFKDDPISIEKISAMEVKASAIFNRVHKQVNDFYAANKNLDRKSYAIKGQTDLAKDGTFSLAMNLYIGREANVKEFLVKNYKSYGIRDEPDEVTD